MERLKAAEQSRGKIFKNKLEWLTKTNWLISFVFYGGVYVFFLYQHKHQVSVGSTIAIITYLTAVFTWTFFEYLIHRYLFHFINESDWSKKFHYAVHGVHHDYPRDDQRLFMPPLPGAIFLVLFTGFFYLFLGPLTYLFMAGFINGWAIYVSIHYIVHVYKPIKPFRVLWTHHAKHHYKSEDKAFGVSSPLWDYIFGTMPD